MSTHAMFTTLAAVGLLSGATGAIASQASNFGARAYLSWSTSDTTAVNLTTPGASNNLYLILRMDPANGPGIDFKGAEIDLTWSANEDLAPACFEHIGSVFKTSAGTTCTYLNRGSAVPVTVADDLGHYHVAWANSSSLTGCTQGVALSMQFEFDACVGAMPRGTFQLNLVRILDSNNLQVGSDTGAISLAGPEVRVNDDHVSLRLLPPPTVTATSGDSVTVQITAQGGVAPITFSSIGSLPDGATLSAGSGYFSWRTASDDSQRGTHVIPILATDATGDTAAANLSVTVLSTHDVLIAPMGDAFATEGEILDLPISYSDKGGFPVTFSLQEPAPPGAAIVLVDGFAHFQWTPSYCAAQVNAGVWQVAISGTDGVDTETITFQVLVADAPHSPESNFAPVMEDIADQEATDGMPLIVIPIAGDEDCDSLIWSVSGAPNGAEFDSTTGIFAWTPPASASQVAGGDYPSVHITVRDALGASAEKIFNIHVSDAPPSIDIPLGSITLHTCTLQKRSLQLTLTDDDTTRFIWHLVGAPAWVAIDSLTGILSGQAPLNAYGLGFDASVTASEPTSGLVSLPAALHVLVDCTPVRPEQAGDYPVPDSPLKIAAHRIPSGVELTATGRALTPIVVTAFDATGRSLFSWSDVTDARGSWHARWASSATALQSSGMYYFTARQAQDMTTTRVLVVR